MTFGSATVSSFQRQRAPTPTAAMLRTVHGRIRKLQADAEMETVTNEEFEEWSRTYLTFLNGEFRALKEVVSSLADAVVAVRTDADALNSAVRKEISRLDERQSEMVNDMKSVTRDVHLQRLKQEEQQQQLIEEQDRSSGPLARRVEQVASDVDAILAIIPKLEDKMVSGQAQGEQRIESVARSVEEQKRSVEDVLEKVESKVGRWGADLRDELDQRHQKLNRQVSRQLEGMQRLLVDSDRIPSDARALSPTSPRDNMERFQARLRDDSEERLRQDERRPASPTHRLGEVNFSSARISPRHTTDTFRPLSASLRSPQRRP